jgi:hypothetical protein
MSVGLSPSLTAHDEEGCIMATRTKATYELEKFAAVEKNGVVVGVIRYAKNGVKHTSLKAYIEHRDSETGKRVSGCTLDQTVNGSGEKGGQWTPLAFTVSSKAQVKMLRKAFVLFAKHFDAMCDKAEAFLPETAQKATKVTNESESL